ncbi:TetR/AcrR family transcriptional regulator [Sphingomonas colocasiae]|uniref:TetR/AcrR family transcriptional regulator n=1 Tax=Sphingomonas colocasiae TaxID=1848973 RepID=A0ABS7PSN4_9SPHN|nr:TetR/AcrR family transcriptional regulator [Sphingomonas colocasiae]MBY8824352.1 TetR/AcrR family transcriptional regulator [Sphingomonas colocasiae]
MDDDALFALGTMTNSSPAMFERRRRILREARRMIGEGRMDDFNIRELCRRAEVSSRTVYNAFGGKEAVIALAIRDYFEAFHQSMTFVSDEDSFDGALERVMAATLRNLQIPNYLRAVTALYFSPTLDPQIRRVLLDIGRRQWFAWLRQVRSRRQLERGIDPEQMAVDLSDLQFAKVHQWGLGALAEDQLVDVTACSVLTHVAGATRGEARASVRAKLQAMNRGTPAWRDFITGIRLRIDQHWIQPTDTSRTKYPR